MSRFHDEFGFCILVPWCRDAIRRRLGKCADCAEQEGRTEGEGAHIICSTLIMLMDVCLVIIDSNHPALTRNDYRRCQLVTRRLSNMAFSPKAMPARDLRSANRYATCDGLHAL